MYICPDINMQIVSINGMTSFKIPMCTTYIYMHRHKLNILEIIINLCTLHVLVIDIRTRRHFNSSCSNKESSRETNLRNAFWPSELGQHDTRTRECKATGTSEWESFTVQS